MIQYFIYNYVSYVTPFYLWDIKNNKLALAGRLSWWEHRSPTPRCCAFDPRPEHSMGGNHVVILSYINVCLSLKSIIISLGEVWGKKALN